MAHTVKPAVHLLQGITAVDVNWDTKLDIEILANPDVRLKDGTSSSGRKILIDGQQRVMALNAAILGESVVNKDYKKVKIRIKY